MSIVVLSCFFIQNRCKSLYCRTQAAEVIHLSARSRPFDAHTFRAKHRSPNYIHKLPIHRHRAAVTRNPPLNPPLYFRLRCHSGSKLQKHSVPANMTFFWVASGGGFKGDYAPIWAPCQQLAGFTYSPPGGSSPLTGTRTEAPSK